MYVSNGIPFGICIQCVTKAKSCLEGVQQLIVSRVLLMTPKTLNIIANVWQLFVFIYSVPILHGMPSFKDSSLLSCRWPVNNLNPLQIYLVMVKNMAFGQQRVNRTNQRGLAILPGPTPKDSPRESQKFSEVSTSRLPTSLFSLYSHHLKQFT